MNNVVAVWNVYQLNFNPSDTIRRRSSPLDNVSLTNGQRAMFYGHTIYCDPNRTTSSSSYEFLFSEHPVVAEYSSAEVYRGL
jgi:hypothetical protein